MENPEKDRILQAVCIVCRAEFVKVLFCSYKPFKAPVNKPKSITKSPSLIKL